MRTNQDTPLIAKAVKRLRKGVYEIELRHPSGRLYEHERFAASTMKEARAMCLRLYPSTVFVPKGKAGQNMIEDYRINAELLAESKRAAWSESVDRTIDNILSEAGIRPEDEPTLEQAKKRRIVYELLMSGAIKLNSGE